MAGDNAVGGEQYILALGLVRKAFQQNEMLAAQHDYPADKIEVLAQETAKKICGLPKKEAPEFNSVYELVLGAIRIGGDPETVAENFAHAILGLL